MVGGLGASALGCMLASASPAPLGQPWYLFHQGLSSRAQISQTDVTDATKLLPDVTPATPVMLQHAQVCSQHLLCKPTEMGIDEVVIMGLLPKISQHLKDGRAALAHLLTGEEGHSLLQSSQ